MSDTPTPIDPADIRPGDVVERRERVTVCQSTPNYVATEQGAWLEKIPGSVRPGVGVTWHLVSRPDPDAEAVEALLAAGLTDDANLIESDTARIARRYLANLREQGWDVVRRAES